MKIPFNIMYKPQIESGEYKVETRDRRPVRIVSWDFLSEKPIIGLIGMGFNNGETIATYYKQGRVTTAHDDCADLFIITPEPELSEFEKAVNDFLNYWNGTNYDRSNNPELKKRAAELLELARKELEPEVLERLEIAYKNQDEVVYENGKRDGKAEVLKDLPRWKPAARAYEGDRLPRIDWLLKRLVAKFEEGIFYIDINDLYKLPGFNE